MLVGQLLADPLDLVPVGQLGGDAVGLAVLGQFLDRVVDPVLVLADDHGGAAGGHHVGGGVAAHPAAAADHHQFLALEHGHSLGWSGSSACGAGHVASWRSFKRSFLLRALGQASLLLAHRQAWPPTRGRAPSDQISETSPRPRGHGRLPARP